MTTSEKFPRSGTRQRFPFLPQLFGAMLKDCATAIRQEKDIQEIQIGKEVNVSLIQCHDNIQRKP